jgi:transcriptional regulator with XRE-family HTH domain
MNDEGSVEQRIRRAVAALVARDGQEGVAEAIGVSQPTVSRYLAGRTRLTLPLVVGLGRAYPDLRPLLNRILDGHADQRDDQEPVAAAAS